MFFVGIDISKFKHDCAPMDDFWRSCNPLAAMNNSPTAALAAMTMSRRRCCEFNCCIRIR